MALSMTIDASLRVLGSNIMMILLFLLMKRSGKAEWKNALRSVLMLISNDHLCFFE